MNDLIERVARVAGWYERKDEDGYSIMVVDGALECYATHYCVFGEWAWRLTAEGTLYLIRELLEQWDDASLFNRRSNETFVWYSYAQDLEFGAPTIEEAAMLAYLQMKETK